ncbi:MAG TPA: CinA family nicotinamide mononucleotide deamidase-related protein [Thermoanaerobaculales bacterium]|nr:CinA family nicotinamide mononucleotide deamidase-related protein [Thermoanaerobaculales bacterium]
MAKGRTAACLAVGSELLGNERLDSNSLAVTRTLAGHGFRVVEKRVVGDREAEIAAAISELLGRVDVVVITGGLGPTADDVTREAMAAALGRRLEADPEAEGWIRAVYQARGRAMPEAARRMAEVVHGARILPNRKGVAPGQLIEVGERLLVALPGVPWEMADMLEGELAAELAGRGGGAQRLTRTLVLGGVYESEVDQRCRALYDRFGRDDVTILAGSGVVRLLLVSEGAPAHAERRLGEMEAAFREVLGADVAGIDVASLEHAVLAELESSGMTVAVAESCTGGLLSTRLTDVPGASAVFLGGVVSYSNRAKEELVGVPREVLIEHGAVSEPTARAMASGVRDAFGSDWGIGITGIAGPTGGSVDKPVGLVHWAVAGPDGVTAGHRVFPGDRPAVRSSSASYALDSLRRRLARWRGRG